MSLFDSAKAPAAPSASTGAKFGDLTKADYHIALNTSDTYTDAAVNAAVNAAIDDLVDQFNALLAHLNDGRV